MMEGSGTLEEQLEATKVSKPQETTQPRGLGTSLDTSVGCGSVGSSVDKSVGLWGAQWISLWVCGELSG